jgi:dTDP-4-dehydrorhamnose 3,5-epimerase
MNIIDTILGGVKIVEATTLRDERGEFSRIFCDDELRGVLNGKAIKQIKIFDVAVDLRKDSSTFLKWFGIELSPLKNIALAIPEGCAHGFQVLEEDSELLYLHTAPYTPSSESAIRFDDPLISITWPITPTEISQRDLSHPYLNQVFKGISI